MRNATGALDTFLAGLTTNVLAVDLSAEVVALEVLFAPLEMLDVMALEAFLTDAVALTAALDTFLVGLTTNVLAVDLSAEVVALEVLFAPLEMVATKLANLPVLGGVSLDNVSISAMVSSWLEMESLGESSCIPGA